jgi:D-threo-aldose 1-dehydrogenase
VPLPAAALQFPFGHPSVAAVIPGPVSPEEVRTNLAWMSCDVPAALWRELKAAGLIRQDAPTPV